MLLSFIVQQVHPGQVQRLQSEGGGLHRRSGLRQFAGPLSQCWHSHSKDVNLSLSSLSKDRDSDDLFGSGLCRTSGHLCLGLCRPHAARLWSPGLQLCASSGLHHLVGSHLLICCCEFSKHECLTPFSLCQITFKDINLDFFFCHSCSGRILLFFKSDVSFSLSVEYSCWHNKRLENTPASCYI